MHDLEYQMWARYEELRREAEHNRLVFMARQRSARSISLYRMVLTRLGSRLCKWGKLLQERYGSSERTSPPKTAKSSV